MKPSQLVAVVVLTMCVLIGWFTLDCSIYIWFFPLGDANSRCGPSLRNDILNEVKMVLALLMAYLAGGNNDDPKP
jgi:hypothetical protein